ncbi:MAG TPA: DUF1697 domain-containing protein, partial [Patescibacteria group bacterium]|nr:DUF1697 domain-containing protein [Patescibacteria group bacterium]
MQTYIAILRGINVSGQKPLKMDELRSALEQAGFKNVQTFIQSGNIIFKGEPAETEAVAQQIREEILKTFGFEVPVIVLTKEELENVFENNHYIIARSEDPSKLHVTFLSAFPDQADIDKVNSKRYDYDDFIICDKVVYLFCPNGYGRTKLSNSFFESKLK